MSDNPLFSVIVSEGIHDVMAITKILMLKGFEEVTTVERIPAPFHGLINQKYPWQNEGQKLTWTVSHPSFLVRDNYWVLVSNAGGESELADNLKSILTLFPKPFTDAALRSTAILADADQKSAPEKKQELFGQLADTFADDDNFEFDPSTPKQIRRFSAAKPFDVYIFPDDQGPGTLEEVLLAGAGLVYPGLLAEAEKYVTYAKALPYTKEIKNNFNDQKAIAGVIANALRPGRANQVSIHDNKWFTEDSLSHLPLHQTLSNFIDRVIN